jgi:hypothetical protein
LARLDLDQHVDVARLTIQRQSSSPIKLAVIAPHLGYPELMTTISLSLAPPALVRLHDVLICLAKFSDTVAIEAEHDLVNTVLLNLPFRDLADEIDPASIECVELHKDGVRVICV